MKIFLIPGLGFDNRIFERLEFDGAEIEYLNWVDPLDDENMKAYAKRFSERIKTDPNKVIIIGQSFGGMVALEIAAILPVKKVIQISSIKSRKELPFHFRIVKPLNLQRFFTKELTIKTVKYWGRYHGYVTAEEQSLIKEMVVKQSNKYLKWALKEMSVWKEPTMQHPYTLVQIHGTKDKVFPLRLIQEPFVKVQDANHFMVYKQAQLLSEIIARELSQP